MPQLRRLMTILPSLTMPRFDEEEIYVLRCIEGILTRHPYMRVDLGGAGPIARELEDVVSARLALLHTEGGANQSDQLASLLTKLGTWEKQLASALSDEAESAQARLRYETTLLLHPEPGQRREAGTASATLACLTRKWEQVGARRPFTSVLIDKARQHRDFLRHSATMPLYWLRRRRIRSYLPSSILREPALRETFFAIEQVGPLVDSFAFKGAAGVPLDTSVALADVAFLYMQLADEFLDELAAAAGGPAKAGRLVRSLYRSDTLERPLNDLTIEHIWNIGVNPEHHPTKFGISLAALFAVLGELAATVDTLLANTEQTVVHATHLFLHHCFQTYLDEIELRERAPGERADQIRLQDAAWHFYRKNNMVMMLWLDLRAHLLGLEPARHAAAIRRWGYLLASFQIFDDLKDIALDLGKQPSYPLQIAANDFPEEFAWIEQRFGAKRRPVTRDEVTEVNFRANGTVRQCMAWSRLIALSHFDSALLYAGDQRWRKSWTRRRNSFNPGRNAASGTRLHVVDRLVQALLATHRRDASAEVDDEQLAFALDAVAYEGSWQIYLALFPNIRAIYRFSTLRMWMTAEEKARAARRLLRRYRPARAKALVDLTGGDVGHPSTGDGLETFTEPIEV